MLPEQTEPPSDSRYERIYAVVRRIPRGRVATYGQVAALAGLAGHARQVGYALHNCSGDLADIPWHRVVNARGEISPRSDDRGSEDLQRSALASEGVEFDPDGRIDLARFQWDDVAEHAPDGDSDADRCPRPGHPPRDLPVDFNRLPDR